MKCSFPFYLSCTAMRFPFSPINPVNVFVFKDENRSDSLSPSFNVSLLLPALPLHFIYSGIGSADVC